jgi:hypothetical protein
MDNTMQTASDGYLHYMVTPNIKFNIRGIKDCTTCANDPTYEEQRQGIVCKSTEDCVDNKQWTARVYKQYPM